MRSYLSERNLVVILFVLVLVTFALAQEDTKKMEKAYIGVRETAGSMLVSLPSSQVKAATTEAGPGSSLQSHQ